MAGEIKAADETFVLGSTEYGFMLAPNGALGFSSSSPFAPKSVTGSRSYADYDPMSAVAFSDFSGGMGQEYADDQTMFYRSANVDTRGKRAILGPQLYSRVYDRNPDPELVTLLPGTEPGEGGVVPYSFGQVTEDNPYSMRAVRFKCPPYALRRLWVPLKTSPLAITIMWALYNDVDGAMTGLVGNNTITISDMERSQWMCIEIPANVTLTQGNRYWLVLINNGQADEMAWYGDDLTYDPAVDVGISAAYDGATWIVQTHGLCLWMTCAANTVDGPFTYTIGAGRDYITRLWGYSGNQVYYWAASTVPTDPGVQPTVAYDGAAAPAPKVLDANIVDACWFQLPGDDYRHLCFALGDATDMVIFDGRVGTETWTTWTGFKAHALAVHNKTIFRAYDTNKVDGSLAGATWGSAIAVGDMIYPVRKLISWNGDVYAGKVDGLYKITVPVGYPATGTLTVERVVDFYSVAHYNNFFFIVEHQGDIYFPIEHGLLRYSSGGVLTPVSPTIGLDETPGTMVRCAHSAMNGLYVGFEGGIGYRSSIMAYEQGHWQPLIELPQYGTMLRSLVLDPGLYFTAPTLWFTDGLRQAHAAMPTDTVRRWTDPDVDYADSGSITFSWVDGKIRTIPKDWIELDVIAYNVGWRADPLDSEQAASSVTVEWWDGARWIIEGPLNGMMVGTPDWQSLGTITRQGLTTLAFPAGSYGQKIQIRLTLDRGSLPLNPTYQRIAPWVEAVVLKYLERPQDSQAFTRTYILAPQTLYRNGQPNTVSIAEQVGWLETLRNSAEPLTFTTWFGKQYSVHIVNYNSSERRLSRGEGQDEGSILVTCQLQKVP